MCCVSVFLKETKRKPALVCLTSRPGLMREHHVQGSKKTTKCHVSIVLVLALDKIANTERVVLVYLSPEV